MGLHVNSKIYCFLFHCGFMNCQPSQFTNTSHLRVIAVIPILENHFAVNLSKEGLGLWF